MDKKKRYLMDEDFEDKADDNDIDDYYVREAPVKRRKKGKHIAAAIVVVVVICVLAAGGMGLMMLIDKYTPNNTRITLYDYYLEHGYTDVIPMEQDEDKPVAFMLVDGEKTDDMAYRFGDVWYFKKDFVDERLNHRFYYDTGNNELIYTTPTKIVTIPFESQAYYVGDVLKKEHYVIARRIDEDIYIAVDFVRDRADFIYEVREEPYRMLVTTEYSDREYVHIGDNGTIRTGASIKDEIISVSADNVNWEVTGTEGDWTELRKDDGVRGYIRTKELGESYIVTTSNDYQAPIYTSVSKKYKINMVWHAVYDMFDNDKI